MELPTTVAELIAIAKPASMGSHSNIPTPSRGTSIPPAIGINPVLYANAQKRFCFILATVFFPRSRAVTTSLISSFISIIPPVYLATSVPEPIAIPKSAVANAGASLIPSPTMATIVLSTFLFLLPLSSFFSLAITCSFCWGNT